jgi:type VI secretion system secreted protein Hcp
MGIYMDFDGIKGEATQQDHKKWIDVLSLSWGTGRGISTTAGSAQNREASEPTLSDVTIVKQFDAASPKLFTEACAGNQGKTVKIDITTTGSPSVTFCTYTLSNALISSYSVSTSGDRPTESVSISYTKMEFKFTPYDDKNKAGTPTTVSYDLATTKKS